jgi:hypothetical protein
MRTVVGRISAFLIVTSCVAGAQNAPAPEAQPPPQQQPVTQPAAQPAQSPADPSKSTDTSAALDYLFNRKPQDGTAGKELLDAGQQAEGKAAAEDAVGIPRQEDPELRARFDEYLAMAEVPQEILAEYFTKMEQVSALLRENKAFEAWRQLHDLAGYTLIDAGISRELANRVESIWTTGRFNAGIDQHNKQLRDDIGTANRNADMLSETVLRKQMEQQRALNQQRQTSQRWQRPPQQQQQRGQNMPQNFPQAQNGNEPPPRVDGLEGKLQLTEEYLRSLELKAKVKLNELKQQKLFEQAKADFSGYVATLFDSGRLNHVVLAADFYRKVFQEGEYPVEMANKVNASLEINRNVQSAVEVFRYKVQRNQLAGANDSLQRAFITNELNSAVLGLDRPLKEKVADFNQKLNRMRNLIEARDFGNLATLLTELQASAPDFDTTKPMAIVNAVKLESKMRLGKAKLAAQQGDLKMAMEEFQAAAEAWPGNPDLEDKALTFFDTQDVKSQSLVEFDRLVVEQNYRTIFDKQLAFAPAIAGDPKREEALKKALETIKDAEVASEKANVMMMNGDSFGAWETIELAAVHLPDDKKLNKLRADLSGRSAEFVSAINKARDAEGRNEIGFSLTWYVNAQRQYPGSRIANEGIERLSGKLLGVEM